MSDQDNLVLYHNDLSTCAQKVRIVLADKSLQWESRELDLRAGDQKSPEFLKLNPTGMVPVLIHDGHVVTESSIILEYLDDAFPAPALRPDGAASKSRMRFWMKRLDDRLHVMTGVLSFALAFRHEYLALPDGGQSLIEATPDPVAKAGKAGLLKMGADFPAVGVALGEFERAFADVEKELEQSDGDFLAGAYSLADAAWAPYLNRFDHLGLSYFWKNCSHVSRWWDAIRARSSFDTAIVQVERPDRVTLMREKSAEAAPRIAQWRASAVGA